MAAAAAAVELLALLKDVLTSEGQAKDGIEAELPAQVLAEHAVNTRKTHKLMYTQLQVVKFLLDFLDSAPCIQDASGAAVRKEMAEAKQQWKALKVEYQQQVEAIKGAVPQVLAKLEEARNRGRLLEDALQRYQAKNREMEEKVRNAQDRCLKEQELLCERQQQLERHVTELQNRVEVHHEELQRLQAELEEQERQASVWKEEMQSISDFRCLLETLRGVKLTCATESDLEVELSSHSQPGTAASHQLKLRLHWENDGNITLQNASPFFPLPDVLPMGACSTIKAFILELQHSYAQQAQLLAEIELLQSCFAIDWQQEKRLVSYLKPSSTCCLYVEPGYPTSGRICLLSVKNQHGTVDVTSYKPPQERPSLKKWLVYLSAVDFSAAS
ncbi:ZW10 interactor-like isoform X1 [Elgaria multicarinata webbii]|uniref:ZW10 interactor-like isoform X1 n=1 Tax=Elgaria multicarinata webbii TaxID=159646 RepID=UPI002FCD0BBD